NTGLFQMVDLTYVSKRDVFAAYLQYTLYKARWIVAGFLGLYALLSISSLNKFLYLYSWQQGIPLILGIVAWIGLLLLGAAAGISYVTYSPLNRIQSLLLIILLLLTLLILPAAFGFTGPAGWVSVIANLLLFTLFPYAVLNEWIKSLPQNNEVYGIN